MHAHTHADAHTTGEDYDKVVFLYQLERGEAGGSYGLNVASLAGMPVSVLKLACGKSKHLRLSKHNKIVADMKMLLDLFSQTRSLCDSSCVATMS